MVIKSAKYYNNIDGKSCGINCTIDDVEVAVPLDPDNRHYAEILRQVAAGTLTIADAD
tara:strand:- start:246 stop:419 length:174 start_codon:yes stop_codon:yes gene_type:complete